MRLLLALVTATALTLAAAGSASAAEPRFSFENRLTGGVFDVPGFSQTPGTHVQDRPFNGGANQLWTAGATTTVGTVHYSELRASHSGQCLDVPGTAAYGSRVVQNPCNGTRGQRWRFEKVGGFQEFAYYRMTPLSAEGKDLTLVVSQWTPGPGQELVLVFKGGETAKPQHFYVRTQ